MATVLVLDGLQRKSLALTRFLGADGHHVLTAESTFFSISRFSRFAGGSFVYPAPAAQPMAFVHWLEQLLSETKVDVVIPTDDDTTYQLILHRDRFHPLSRLLLPPLASFRAMRDKAESAKWFTRMGIPHPRVAVIQNLSEVRPAAEDLGLPLVIKARVASGSRGLLFAYRLEDVERMYAEVHRDYPWPILQQFITPGPKHHVCLMYDSHGQVAARYVQRELRQYPITGGPSTMQECVHRPDLTDILEPLFRELPWSGVLSADVMEDGQTGQPYVLEVNPRYWSSLQLAHRAGVNFGRLHVALALGERPPTPAPARAGVRGRALLPFDVLAYLTDPQRGRMNPPFFSGYGPDTWDDLLSWSDPGPTLGFGLAVCRYLFDRKMWRAVLRLEAQTSSQKNAGG